MPEDDEKYRDHVKKAENAKPKHFERPAAVVNKVPEKADKKKK